LWHRCRPRKQNEKNIQYEAEKKIQYRDQKIKLAVAAKKAREDGKLHSTRTLDEWQAEDDIQLVRRIRQW
jgi:hypothetical protein